MSSTVAILPEDVEVLPYPHRREMHTKPPTMITFALRIEMFIPRVRPYPVRHFPDELIQTMELITDVFAEYVCGTFIWAMNKLHRSHQNTDPSAHLQTRYPSRRCQCFQTILQKRIRISTKRILTIDPCPYLCRQACLCRQAYLSCLCRQAYLCRQVPHP